MFLSYIHSIAQIAYFIVRVYLHHQTILESNFWLVLEHSGTNKYESQLGSCKHQAVLGFHAGEFVQAPRTFNSRRSNGAQNHQIEYSTAGASGGNS